MDNIFEDVFSEYTVTDVAFRPKGQTKYIIVDGAGSASESYERKKVTKAKSNVVVKTISRQSGTGKLSLKLHMPEELYHVLQGFETGENADLISGVHALGGKVKIPSTEIAMKIEDEDGEKKVKYFPAATSSKFERSTESEGDNVAEVDMEFDLSTDKYKWLVYEALAKNLPKDGTITEATWLEAVSSDALHTPAAEG